MSLFKFRIYDYHEKPVLTEDGLIFDPIMEQGLMTFHLVIDVTQIRIVSFRAMAILNDDNDVIAECTKVILSDGSFVLATNKFETFEANYKSDYLPLIG